MPSSFGFLKTSEDFMSRHSLPAGQTGGLIVREITDITHLNWTLSSEGFTNFQVIDDGTFSYR